MHKFIVMGNWCEYMAHLHTEAENEQVARSTYEAVFSEDQKRGLFVQVVNCTESPWMLKHWKEKNEDGTDYAYYSGGYRYAD